MSCRILPLLLLAALLAPGCAGSPKPPVKVLGVTDAHAADASRVLLVFLEVRNPTKRKVALSQLDYQFEARPWFATEGRMQVQRSIAAGGSAVIEIPVRIDRHTAGTRQHEVEYTFEGTLRVRSGNVESRWPVSASGELASHGTGERSAYIVRPADTATE